jgi:release factor glutamine methyltransferase
MKLLAVLEATTGHFARHGLTSPRLQAELLTAHVLSLPRLGLYLQFERELTPTELDSLRSMVRRRAAREPVQHITGTTGFAGLTLRCNSSALIPRPETELLVDLALEHLQLCPAESPSILDLCTGSGCVGIAILANHPSAAAVLTDLSPDAIAIAWQNAELHGVFERCQIIVGDLDSDIATEDTFDVITANPPYIDPDDIETLDIEVRDWEPELALYAPDAGYALYPRIAALALSRLRPGGFLAVECGHTQAGTIADMFAAAGLTNIKIHPDLAGIPRVVTANQL